jgi:hypothetical protein
MSKGTPAACIKYALSHTSSNVAVTVYLFEVTNNPEEYTQYEIATTIKANENLSFRTSPTSCGLIGDDRMTKPKGTAPPAPPFYFIISWATTRMECITTSISQNQGCPRTSRSRTCSDLHKKMRSLGLHCGRLPSHDDDFTLYLPNLLGKHLLPTITKPP